MPYDSGSAPESRLVRFWLSEKVSGEIQILVLSDFLNVFAFRKIKRTLSYVFGCEIGVLYEQ